MVLQCQINNSISLTEREQVFYFGIADEKIMSNSEQKHIKNRAF